MEISQVAAQLYTLRNFCKTPADTAQTLKKVRAIGYEAVQVSGVASMPEAELKAMLDSEGLICCATHEPTQKILDEPQSVIERLRKLDCKATAIPSHGQEFKTADDVKAFAKRMNAAGKVFSEAGIVLGYHNHHFEFIKVGDKTILEHFYDETDPRYLQGEPDTYWIQFGGASPLEWCHKLNGRLPLIHLKDYGVSAEKKPEFREIGYGNLNWNDIIPAAEKAGCQWFIVEQDTCPGDPFDSLKMSFDFLKANFG